MLFDIDVICFFPSFHYIKIYGDNVNHCAVYFFRIIRKRQILFPKWSEEIPIAEKKSEKYAIWSEKIEFGEENELI